MIGDAISFPKSGDDWLSTLVIGGLLSVLGIFVLPALIVQGYMVRVLACAARDESPAPSFTDWGGLLVDGLKLFTVNLAYGLVIAVPVTFLLGVTAFVVAGTISLEAAGAGAAPRAIAGLVGGVLGLLALGVGGFLGLLVGYVAPAGYANFAVEGRIAAAFDVAAIRRAAFTGDYAVAWLLALLVGVLGTLVALPLTLLVVGVFLLFWVQVSVHYLFGRGFGAALERSTGERASGE